MAFQELTLLSSRILGISETSFYPHTYWSDVRDRIKEKQKELQEQINSQAQEAQSNQNQITMLLMILKWIDNELGLENEPIQKIAVEIEPPKEGLSDREPYSSSRP